MRKVIIISLLVLSLALVACIQEEDGNGPVSNGDSTPTQEAPRIEVTPTPTIPPTFTPSVAGERSHISPVTGPTIHTVQPGDTLGFLASQYATTVKVIADANRIYDYDLIEVGDELYIPPCDLYNPQFDASDLQ
jgi:nucleoid-associated protein YgaU